MSSIPDWLSEEAIERTEALGREMAIFLQRRNEAKCLNPSAKIEPHQRLLELISSVEEEARRISRRPNGNGALS